MNIRMLLLVAAAVTVMEPSSGVLADALYTTPESMAKIADQAISDLRSTITDYGTIGLEKELRIKYAKAVRTHDQYLAIYCVVQDRYAAILETNKSPTTSHDPYFWFPNYVDRARQVMAATVPSPKYRPIFIRTLMAVAEAEGKKNGQPDIVPEGTQ